MKRFFRLAFLGALTLTGCNQAPQNPASSAEPTPTPAVQPQPAPRLESGQPQTLPMVDLHIDHATLHTAIATDEKEREVGLMYVAKLPDNDGMIFLMPTVEQATFWMKNTLIPLSVAFIDRNGTILDIHDMKAMDESTVRSDNDQVAYALEANLHWFALNGIKAGDKIEPPPVSLGAAQP
jgi:uncharacterized membrane protein (UPF0127 family)